MKGVLAVRLQEPTQNSLQTSVRMSNDEDRRIVDDFCIYHLP